MMIESLCGEHKPSSFEHDRDKTRRAVRRPGAAVLVLTAQPEWLLRTSADVPRAGSTPSRTDTTHIAPLAALRRSAAIIRAWRQRARSRQQVRELNDHLLKDIGLSRDAACYETGKPFWR